MKYVIISLLSLSMTNMSCDDATNELVVKETNPIVLLIQNLPKEPLSDAEVSALLLMREEEKMARDVYDYLYDQWSVQIFRNISSSEQMHMDAVLNLLDKYDLADPAKEKSPGVFENQNLQQLYDQLVEKGSLSLLDALEVGATIEDVDIRDLQVEVNTNVDNADITIVFENLMKGSRNHLRSFVKNIENAGGTYTPQYLTQEEYDAIINSGMERGRK